jgi:hypothetical protein
MAGVGTNLWAYIRLLDSFVRVGSLLSIWLISRIFDDDWRCGCEDALICLATCVALRLPFEVAGLLWGGTVEASTMNELSASGIS